MWRVVWCGFVMIYVMVVVGAVVFVLNFDSGWAVCFAACRL